MAIGVPWQDPGGEVIGLAESRQQAGSLEHPVLDARLARSFAGPAQLISAPPASCLNTAVAVKRVRPSPCRSVHGNRALFAVMAPFLFVGGLVSLFIGRAKCQKNRFYSGRSGARKKASRLARRLENSCARKYITFGKGSTAPVPRNRLLPSACRKPAARVCNWRHLARGVSRPRHAPGLFVKPVARKAHRCGNLLVFGPAQPRML